MLLENRRVTPRALPGYVSMLSRVEAFCRAEGLSIDTLAARDLDRFGATLSQTPTAFGEARRALKHYWLAIGRESFPSLEVGGSRVRSTRPAELRIEKIGGRPISEVRLMLERRRLGPKSVTHYLSMLVRVEVFCREEGLSLGQLDDWDVARFAGTLKQSTSVLGIARTALNHYWEATGRRDRPKLRVTDLLANPFREQGSAAGERKTHGANSWAQSGYDSSWIVDRLRARHLGRKTAYFYQRRLLNFARWCIAEGTTIDTFTGADLEIYAGRLPNTRSTQMELHSALKHYGAISNRSDVPIWMIRVPRQARMICRALEDDEARKLEVAALERKDAKGLAVIIGLYLALRRFEIAKLRWADFDDGWLHVVGKFDQEAKLPVHPVVTSYLGRQRNDSLFVFPGRLAGSINPTTLSGWVKEVGAAAGVEITTHILRHTALATANDETGDLRATQEFARHAEPATTAGYTRATPRRLIGVSEAIAGFYAPTSPAELGAGEGRGPRVSLEWMVRTVEGPHAVGPWLELASVVDGRPGWRLASEGEGSGFFDFRYGDGSLTATVHTYTGDRPPVFSIDRCVGPTAEDIVFWDFGEVAVLGAVLSTFETGGVPFPPTGSFVVKEDDDEGFPAEALEDRGETRKWENV
jgi:integrase